MDARAAFVAVTGALAIAAAGFGLGVVESRPSHEAALEPVEWQVRSQGRYEVTPASGTWVGGTCVPPPPATACTQARTDVEWRLDGLPAAPVAYVAFLRAGAETVPIGPLEDGALAYQAEGEVRAEALVLRLGGVDVLEVPLPGGLDGLYGVALPGAGAARLDQIGAISVSLLAFVEVEAPKVEGVEYAVWLEETRLGTITFHAGRGHLEERLERVEVPRQGRVEVRLEGAGGALVAYGAQLGPLTTDA